MSLLPKDPQHVTQCLIHLLINKYMLSYSLIETSFPNVLSIYYGPISTKVTPPVMPAFWDLCPYVIPCF